ncbi:serine--tRNA mitochondrial-like [Brachionus plicatilis]|uniref:serine--tRNA ligase n=1 Tax=Brachionus plicatilis TaxID=10195 RepID=A0A3M7QBU2_BRAPC|nr:serine--tRNA mitochondrial-like [Brachionus plicatilis]
MFKIFSIGIRNFSKCPLRCQVSKDHLHLIENNLKKIRIFDEIDLYPAGIDWKYVLNPANLSNIEDNIKKRKGNGDIIGLHRLNEDLKQTLKTGDQHEIEQIIEAMYHKAVLLPNFSDPSSPIGAEENAECVMKVGDAKNKSPTVDQIAKMYGWLREEQISLYSMQRSYILKKELADLETALVRYTLNYLNDQVNKNLKTKQKDYFRVKGFILVSVPDILHHSIIESCGFATKGERNQVYKLDFMNEYGKYCLSGTSEMSLAGLLKNKVFNEKELPLNSIENFESVTGLVLLRTQMGLITRLCAVSRCFRAEVSGSEREGKLYRLHEFTKVEMFVLTIGDLKVSSNMLEKIRAYQIELFSDLGIHFRVLNMPTHELGSPAFKKYDIEAWMPGNQFYGEISSTSNCTSYQSRRLHIKSSKDKTDLNQEQNYVHTLNGTACAVPRMLTTLIESNWDMENELVRIPSKLQCYMNGRTELKVPKDFRKAEPLRSFK